MTLALGTNTAAGTVRRDQRTGGAAAIHSLAQPHHRAHNQTGALPRRVALRRPMTGPVAERVYALQVGETAVLTFAATSNREAQSLTREEWLRAELRAARVNGQPIWDGAAKLTIRIAVPEEAARYAQGAKASSDADGDLDLVYLVALDK